MKVRDHKKFCHFDYESDMSNTNFQLGDIVTKVSEDGTEIGVVIQLHDDGDIRTDMFGNASPSEVTLSTIEEIVKFRFELAADVFELDEKKLKALTAMSEAIKSHDHVDEVTVKIVKALEHVKSIYPDVCMVVYNKDGRWQYMDEDFKAPMFKSTPQEVDISILEDAADSVPYLPYVYQA